MRKNILITLLIAIAMFAIATAAFAEPKYVETTPPYMSGDTVHIGNLPSGYTLIDVEVYDDVRGIPPRSIGAKSSFDLRKGEGFNFIYRAPDGHEYYQMVTEYSETGEGIYINCNRNGGSCKYLYPTESQLSKMLE